MSRRSRGNVEHTSAAKALEATKSSGGINDALDKVKEMSEAGPAPEPEHVPASAELKDLVLFGRVTDSVSVGGYTIKMSTLSNREQKSLVKRLVKLEAEERLMNVKTFTLSQSIKSINGLPLEDLYDGDEDLDVDGMKIEVVSDFQSTLSEKLFDKYEELVSKSNDVFKEGDLADKVKNS
jgi:hypothetical protein